MILGLDTETTGLPDWRSPSDADHQPHLVQLAMILMDDDLTERASVSLIIRPDGWVIPEEGPAAVHGITNDMANRFGVPEAMAARLFAQMAYGTSALAVGHNVPFDIRIMRIALLRAGFKKDQLDARKLETFCTMQASTHLVNLPPTEKMLKAGCNKPKVPKLEECIRFFFGEELTGAHDALIDVRASLRIFQHLRAATAPPEEFEEEAV